MSKPKIHKFTISNYTKRVKHQITANPNPSTLTHPKPHKYPKFPSYTNPKGSHSNKTQSKPIRPLKQNPKTKNHTTESNNHNNHNHSHKQTTTKQVTTTTNTNSRTQRQPKPKQSENPNLQPTQKQTST